MSAFDNSISRKVASLMMEHCGCHKVDIYELYADHRKMMKEKRPYNPSHLRTCISISPVINRYSSKGLKVSDKPFSLRHNNPLLSIIKHSEFLKDKSGNPLLKSKRIPGELTRSYKPRPSDAFLLRIPEEITSDSKSKTFDPLKSRRIICESRSDKPRPSDAFLKVSECPSDADDESTDDLRRSRRIPSINPLRRTIRPSEIIRRPNVSLTEDDELIRKKAMRPIDPSYFSVSGRWMIENGQLIITSEHPVMTKIERDPEAQKINISLKEEVLYNVDCSCDFCKLLKQYNYQPLLFSRRFKSKKGHGFFPKL